MNLSAIYSKTGKGARALAAKSKGLSANTARILSYIDGKTSADAILPQLGKFSENKFTEALLQLISEGYIKEIDGDYLAQSLSEFEIHTPIMVAEISAEEFMKIETAADNRHEEIKSRQQAEAEARANAYAEAQRKLEEETRKQEESERRLLKVTDILAKSGDSLDIEQLASKDTPRPQPKTDSEARAKHKARKRAAAEEARRAAKHAETMLKPALDAKLPDGVQTQDEQVQIKHEEQEKLKLEAQDAAEHKAQMALEMQAKQQAQKAAQTIQLAATVKARKDEENHLQRETEKQVRAEAEQRALETKQKAQQQAKDIAKAAALQQAQARAQQKAEEQARLKMEKQAKAEHKANEAAQAQARREAKQKLKAEQLARKQAEAEMIARSKALAKHEAEERARVVAANKALEKMKQREQTKAEKLAKAAIKYQGKLQSAAKRQEKALDKAQQKLSRSKIKIFSGSGKILALTRNMLIAVSLCLVLLLALLPLINLSFLIDPVESSASQSIGEPVTIKTLHVSLWPRPHLTADGVIIGNAADIKAGSIKLYPVFSTLTEEVQVFHSIDMENLALDENNAKRPLLWLKNIDQNGHVKIEHIDLHKLAITWQGLALPVFNGDMELNTTGALQTVLMKTEGGNLSINVTARNSLWALDITATAWQFPFGPPVQFDELKANGVLTQDGLQLDRIEGRLYGGNLRAFMAVDWVNGWHGNGKFNLSQIDLAQAIPVFTDTIKMEGRLATNASFSTQADTLSKLFEAPSINAHFDSRQGVINGIDLVRAIQANSKQKAINGTTGFDQFSGNLLLENKHYQFRDLILQANQLQARGETDIFANQDISGKIDIKLAVKSRQVQSRIYLSGKLAQPSIK